MSLESMYQTLRAQASRTEEPRGQTLTGGARITVRVRDGRTTLTISRKNKPVGASELETFRAACSVPPDAERSPSEGQKLYTDDAGVVWHYLSFRWAEGEST